MNKLTLLFLIIPLMLLGQGDMGGTGFSAPVMGNMGASPSGKISGNTSIFDRPPTSSGMIEAPEPNRNFGKTQDFANPNQRILDNLNRKEGNETQTAIRKNQYMGDVRTKGDKVKIRFRDHGYPDGDLIKIWINETVLKSMVLLDTEFESIEINLVPGFNKLDFEALNQGSSGPNTAEFEIFDKKGNLLSSNRWNLATGFKATIIVVMENHE
jgi:hypothetical protein